MLGKRIEKIIEKHALVNASQHKGKASEKAVLARVLGELKGKVKEKAKLSRQIASAVRRINKLSQAKQAELLKKYPAVKKKEKRTGLPELKKSKKYVFRFEPSPTGMMHIGHIFGLMLNYLYKEKYGGKLILRIADTNPSNIYMPAYVGLELDAEWITQNGIDEVHIQSDRMKIYYDYAERVIRKKAAYVCTCQPEKFKEVVLENKSCPCRNSSVKENLEKWKDMLFLRYPPGEAALRIKTESDVKNPAIREWVAFRITDEKHPRYPEYKVWPTMNFAVAVDDHLMGLTHVIRGKEHETNAEKQAYIFKAFKWKKPEYIHVGRINYKGLQISKSGFRKDIESKKLSGWDDVRLPTLRAFRRRGLQPGAFAKYVLEVGPSKSDKTVAFEEFMKTIYKFNREIIDPSANRLFFVAEPIKIELEKLPSKTVEIKNHPDRKDRRIVEVNKDIWISKSDAQKFKGKNIRLMNLANIRLPKVFKATKTKILSKEVTHSLPKIQWVSKGAVKSKILMPDGAVVKGISEPAIKNLRAGDIIQFERVGFVRLDAKQKNELIFVFSHK